MKLLKEKTFRSISLLFIFWLIVSHVFVLLANNRVDLRPDAAYSWIVPEYTFQVRDWDALALHARWDSYWYQDIANNGYSYTGADHLSNIAFYPLYPMTIRAFQFFTGANPVTTGFFISIVCLFFSLVFLYLIIKKHHSDTNPIQAVLMLLLFPTAFFLTAVYSESMFLLFSLGAFYFALEKNVFKASVFGMLAALTRFTGIFLLLPLMIEFLPSSTHKYKPHTYLSLLLIPAGTISFLLYHYYRFGSFWLFFDVQSLWGRGFVFGEDFFALQNNSAIAQTTTDIAFVLLVLLATYYAFRKLRLSYAVYMFSALFAPLSTGSLASIGRYVLMLFPIYILGGQIKHPLYRDMWIIVSTLFFGMFSMLFVAHYWAG